MGLVATIARYEGPGILASSAETNKVRQIVQALKTLEGLELVRSASGVTGQVRRGILLRCENGKSTKAASIPYTVPDGGERFLEIPVGFFTQGWVHVLTTSEIAALLMWFDVLKFSGLRVRLREDADPVTMGFVNSEQRHGYYGLGRETYETHKQLEAVEILDVYRPEKRYKDGKWQGFAENSSDMACHKVVLVPGAFERDAGDAVLPVLRERDATGLWRRPVQILGGRRLGSLQPSQP
ncbi:hypothetical protein [Streptomyces atratus]